ncbi:hypothetical protein KCU88_g374, partial [Aureobasidium melanogenum]
MLSFDPSWFTPPPLPPELADISTPSMQMLGGFAARGASGQKQKANLNGNVKRKRKRTGMELRMKGAFTQTSSRRQSGRGCGAVTACVIYRGLQTHQQRQQFDRVFVLVMERVVYYY